jgi:hypothetical protein
VCEERERESVCEERESVCEERERERKLDSLYCENETELHWETEVGGEAVREGERN